MAETSWNTCARLSKITAAAYPVRACCPNLCCARCCEQHQESLYFPGKSTVFCSGNCVTSCRQLTWGTFLPILPFARTPSLRIFLPSLPTFGWCATWVRERPNEARNRHFFWKRHRAKNKGSPELRPHDAVLFGVFFEK